MKYLTKNSVANVAKVGVASALIGAGLFLSACGGDSGGGSEYSKTESFIKKERPDVKILSFNEAKKEFGIKDDKCLTEKFAKTINRHFAKTADGEVVVFQVSFDEQMIKDGFPDDALSLDKTYAIDDFKARNSKCF